MAFEQAAREVLQAATPGDELRETCRVLAGLLGLEPGEKFDAAALDALTPEVILRFDALVEAAAPIRAPREAVRALRAAVIYRVQ